MHESTATVPAHRVSIYVLRLLLLLLRYSIPFAFTVSSQWPLVDWLVLLWLRGRLLKRLYSEWIKWTRIFRTNKICSNCVGDPNKTDLCLFGVTVRYPKLHCRSAPKLTPSADKQSSHVLVIDDDAAFGVVEKCPIAKNTMITDQSTTIKHLWIFELLLLLMHLISPSSTDQRNVITRLLRLLDTIAKNNIHNYFAVQIPFIHEWTAKSFLNCLVITTPHDQSPSPLYMYLGMNYLSHFSCVWLQWVQLMYSRSFILMVIINSVIITCSDRKKKTVEWKCGRRFGHNRSHGKGESFIFVGSLHDRLLVYCHTVRVMSIAYLQPVWLNRATTRYFTPPSFSSY